MNLLEKSRDFLKKVSGSQGKNINKIFGYLLIGIIILLASNLFLKKPLKETNINKKPPIISAENTYDSNINKNETKISLEKQLKETLSCIYGVGKVEVMMTLQSTDEIEPAYDITETIKKSDEEDAQGGIRHITDLNKNKQVVVIRNQSGYEKPVIVKTSFPRIEGVIVIAEGASNSIIKEMIISATETALNIPVHKIKVLPMKQGG